MFIYRNHKSFWQRSLCADSLQKLLYFGSGLVNKLTVGSSIYFLLSCSIFWSMTKCRSEETMGRIPDTDCKSPIHWPHRLERNSNPGTELQKSFHSVYFSKFKASAAVQRFINCKTLIHSWTYLHMRERNLVWLKASKFREHLLPFMLEIFAFRLLLGNIKIKRNTSVILPLELCKLTGVKHMLSDIKERMLIDNVWEQSAKKNNWA